MFHCLRHKDILVTTEALAQIDALPDLFVDRNTRRARRGHAARAGAGAEAHSHPVELDDASVAQDGLDAAA